MPVEYRVAPVRAEQDLEAGAFEGYAATFWAVDSYGTAFAPKAFRKTLSERADRVPLLLQHNPDWNIGVPTTLREDGAGLFQQSRLFDDGGTTVGTGSVALRQLRQGARYGMSFGFNTMRDRAASPEDPLDMGQVQGMSRDDVRIITEVRLWEISLVTFPANEMASVTGVRESGGNFAGVAPGVLAEMLDALRNGTLDAATRDALSEIVKAWNEAEPTGAIFAVPSLTSPAPSIVADAPISEDIRENIGDEADADAVVVEIAQAVAVETAAAAETSVDSNAAVNDTPIAERDEEAAVAEIADSVAEILPDVPEEVAEIVSVRNRRAELDWALAFATAGKVE